MAGSKDTKQGQQSSTPLVDSILSGNIDPSMLAGGSGVGPVQQYSPDQIISNMLADTAKSVLPSSGFKYGQDQLPEWFPDVLRPVVQGTVVDGTPVGPKDLQGVYDPYLGMVSQQGDERVYLGQKKRKVWVGGQDMIDWTAVLGGHKQQGVGAPTKLGASDFSSDPNALGIPAGIAAPEKNPKGHQKTKESDKTKTLEQVLNLPYLWSDEKVHDAMKKFRQAGVNITNFDDLTQAWGSLVNRAAMMYDLSAGQRKVTPWDVLEMTKRESQAAGNYTNFENGSKTTTSRSVSDITEGASWQVLRQTLSTLLGRDPSDQELRDYTYRMNQLAAQNPTVTQTISHFKAGDMVSQKSHTKGGFDAGDMAHQAYDQAQADPDYGAYQAGATYFNAAVDALGAIGGS